MSARGRQGGFAGLIVLLLVLAIVGLLGKTLLGQMGLLAAPATPPKAASATKHVSAPANAEVTDAAATPPGAALDKARGLEQAVREGARQNDERIDKATAP